MPDRRRVSRLVFFFTPLRELRPMSPRIALFIPPFLAGNSVRPLAVSTETSRGAVRALLLKRDVSITTFATYFDSPRIEGQKFDCMPTGRSLRYVYREPVNASQDKAFGRRRSRCPIPSLPQLEHKSGNFWRRMN